MQINMDLLTVDSYGIKKYYIKEIGNRKFWKFVKFQQSIQGKYFLKQIYLNLRNGYIFTIFLCRE